MGPVKEVGMGPIKQVKKVGTGPIKEVGTGPIKEVKEVKEVGLGPAKEVHIREKEADSMEMLCLMKSGPLSLTMWSTEALPWQRLPDYFTPI
jgi:hypothetical protein